MSKIIFNLHKDSQVTPFEVEFEKLFAIGYAGRNMEKTLEHIKELEEQLGVPAPKQIPTIFECSNNCLTQEENLSFIGNRSCGEVEYVIVLCDKKIYISVGSDHTDRELESISVLKAKQICAKPISLDLWDYEDLKDHWDSIRLVSYQTVDGNDVEYQDGTLADILPADTIIAELTNRVGELPNSIIFSGTVPTLDGFKYGTAFKCAMIDDKLSRSLACNYQAFAITEEER